MPLRLKHLELQGYKTFASRTVFQFADTVTAIVGPNGSGKSNIADSIRWVLGEQSYSLLRGKKTEDMIFSGSEQRSRAGMASATILFDNSDGWLPIDFSEVAITRRAYRDGQNEYLLNGQRVRLRDVSELLAQSGLAERTYTIIGQGLVDAALALKAEERRRLFEEAAGIGLYRSRREEAIKRLETTRRNLERVQDILAELQPRLRSLERQARRSQEYEQIKADLRLILREWYGYHWHHAQKDLSEARETARIQENALDKARLEENKLKEKVTLSQEKIQALRTRLGGWHRQLGELHTQRETVTRNLAVIDERWRALSEQQENARQEVARLGDELQLHEERLSRAVEEVSRLHGELQEAQAQVEAARVALQIRQNDRAEVENQVRTARREVAELASRQAQFQARLTERQAHIERQQKALQAAIQNQANSEQQLREREKHLKQAALAREKAQTALKNAQEELIAHGGCLAEAEGEQKEIQESLAAQERHQARLKAQLDVLDQAENALVGYASGAKLLIQAARKRSLKGARGALSSFLEVPAELETAIAAALGEFLDAVIVENDSVSDMALEMLEGEAARAALLPIDGLNPGSGNLPKNGSQDGVVGVAADLVSAPAELKAVVNLLLGQVWIVVDRQAARQIVAEKNHQIRAVTLRGEVFFGSGPILAGQEGKPGTLSRQRQRREIIQTLEEHDLEAQDLSAQLQSIRNRIRELQTERERLEQEMQQAQREAEEVRKAYNQNELAVEKAQRQLQWQGEQRSQMEKEIELATSDSSRITRDLQNLETKLEQARQALRDQNAALEAIPLDEAQSQLSHWRTLAAVSERASAEAQNLEIERRESLERARRTRSSLERRLQEYADTLENLEQEKAALRGRESTLNRDVDILRVQVEPAERELTSAEREQAELRAVETGVRQSLSLAEHHFAQARINLARRQENLDSLRRRIEDDFGLVAFDYAEEVSGPTPLPLDGMVEELPKVEKLSAEIEEAMKRQRAQLRRIGPVNPEAQAEYQQVKERFSFMNEQVADLNQAEIDIKEVIAELDLLMEREFRKTFDAVAAEFRDIFSRLFGGGSARLVLTDPDDLTDTGIDIEARLPGRRTQGLSLLSGGERSLTATALVFSLLKVSPTPFCLLDEVDAMLDEANVGRFRELLTELSRNTQFIVVTHNRNTVQAADVIYGITMGRDSASQVISLRLDEVSKIVQ